VPLSTRSLSRALCFCNLFDILAYYLLRMIKITYLFVLDMSVYTTNYAPHHQATRWTFYHRYTYFNEPSLSLSRIKTSFELLHTFSERKSRTHEHTLLFFLILQKSRNNQLFK
jgi:hypothetical protein